MIRVSGVGTAAAPAGPRKTSRAGAGFRVETSSAPGASAEASPAAPVETLGALIAIQSDGSGSGGSRAKAVAAALESGQLAGYAGDVWFPQPPPKDHPWRTMPHHGMTPHVSGTSLSAQARYAAGVREILECWFDDRPIREEYLIVQGGKLAGAGAHSYTKGDATGGSEEAARFSE